MAEVRAPLRPQHCSEMPYVSFDTFGTISGFGASSPTANPSGCVRCEHGLSLLGPWFGNCDRFGNMSSQGLVACHLASAGSVDALVAGVCKGEREHAHESLWGTPAAAGVHHEQGVASLAACCRF